MAKRKPLPIEEVDLQAEHKRLVAELAAVDEALERLKVALAERRALDAGLHALMDRPRRKTKTKATKRPRSAARKAKP